MKEQWLSTDDLIARTGGTVSRPQLERWLKAGLLPQPRRRGLGRGKGTVSLYPPVAAAMLDRLLMLKGQTDDIRQWRWQLWLDGYPIDREQLRQELVATLDRSLIKTEGVITRLQSETAQQDRLAGMEALVRTALGSRAGGMLRLLTKRIGRGADLQSLLIWAMSAALGYDERVGWNEPLEELGPGTTVATLAANVFGLPAGAESEDPSVWLSLTALRTALETVTDGEWRSLRRDWQALTGVVSALEEVARVTRLPRVGQLAIELAHHRYTPAMVTAALIHIRRSPAVGNHEGVMATLRVLTATIKQTTKGNEEPPRPLQRSGGMASGKVNSRCAPTIPPSKPPSAPSTTAS